MAEGKRSIAGGAKFASGGIGAVKRRDFSPAAAGNILRGPTNKKPGRAQKRECA